MFEEINKELRELREKVILKEKIECRTKKLKNDIDKKLEEQEQLRKNVEKEYGDVKRLEEFSFSNFIATILRNKEDKLYKEQQEYIYAKMKLDESNQLLKDMKNSLEFEEKRLLNLRGCDMEYDKLFSQKEAKLKSFGDEGTREKLNKIEEEINSILMEITEIQEAYTAGRQCLSIVQKSKELLESAKDWGTYDIFGGDLLSSSIKHNKIDEAQEYLNKIPYYIKSLNKELNDININFIIEDLRFESFTRAFDIFFDNIFTDMAVQDKILDALAKVETLERRLNNVIHELDNREKIRKNDINELKREYQLIIEQAQ